jgi:hypothetical protein
MRRWAVTEQAAAQAVVEGDKAIAGHAIEALHQLGYQGTEADDWAEVIVTVIQSIQPRAYETLLSKLDTTTATRHKPYAVAIAPGAVPDELVIYGIAQNLPPDALRQLRANAQQFAASVNAAGNPPEASQGTVALPASERAAFQRRVGPGLFGGLVRPLQVLPDCRKLALPIEPDGRVRGHWLTLEVNVGMAWWFHECDGGSFPC